MIGLPSEEKITLNSAKNHIRNSLNIFAENFIIIGYYLKQVRDNKMYLEEGYVDIYTFAKNEFGMSMSNTSRYMSINDKFSLDGNSPELLDNFKKFSVSMLTEMINMPEEKIAIVTEKTTIKEIRSIKNPDKTVATSQQERANNETPKNVQAPKKPYYECDAYRQHQYSTGCKDCFYDRADCPYDRTGYFEELKRKEEWRIHCEVLKEMCNSICKMSSYILEKNSYSMETIKSLSRKDQDFSFGFGDDGTGHSKYSAWYKAKTNQYKVEEFLGVGKWIFEAGEVDQDIWNFNSRDWKNNQPQPDSESKQEKHCFHKAGTECNIVNLKEVANDLGANCNGKCCWGCKEDCGAQCNPAVEHQYQVDSLYHDENSTEIVTESIETAPEYTEVVIDGEEDDTDEVPCRSCKYDTMNPDEYLKDHPGATLPCIACDDKFESWRPRDFEEEARLEEEPDPVETVEADIIQTVSEEPPRPIFSAEHHLREAIQREEEQLKQLGETWKVKQPDTFLKHQTIMIALKCQLTEMEFAHDQLAPPVQPELPILKNNDQRKDFIDAFETWPIWIDTAETGERYYRYEMNRNVALVVKVSMKHVYSGYKETKEIEFGAEQYYLHGVKSEWNAKGMEIKEDATRTFHECSTNKSSLIEYLKEFQKKK